MRRKRMKINQARLLKQLLLNKYLLVQEYYIYTTFLVASESALQFTISQRLGL